MTVPTESSLPLIATPRGRTLGGITVRRLSWHEFWQLRPDRQPANDNTIRKDAA